MLRPKPTPRNRLPDQSSGLAPHVKIGLLTLGFLLLAALIADLSKMERSYNQSVSGVATTPQEIILGLDGPVYYDPKGFFTIVPPTGWTVVSYPKDRPYSAVIEGPYGITISIMACSVEYNNLQPLLLQLNETEKQFGVDTHIEAVYFLGRPAIQRTSRLHHVKVYSIDFVENYVTHHMLCRIPPDLYDRYLPAITEVLNTYKPCGGRTAPATNAPPG
jgi:hypothetical protein